MSWISTTLTSSLGKKLIVGITGLFLCSFLVVHCGINSLIFLNDGGEAFNIGAYFMATNPVIKIMEYVLFLGLIAHIVQTLLLALENKKARPVGYFKENGNANSKWYSRSMAILGTLILIFLILHLKHFWWSKVSGHLAETGETMFAEMLEIFEKPIIVVIYVLAQISLAYHLLHGFSSAFQTLGFNHIKYNGLIKSVGVVFSLVLPIAFAAMPIVIYFGIIK
ncbi:MAG: succinate dehydrogenase [Bacteroidetes bacterium]|nr:MAG: succinate dehydrogenase [Bacteroidota bacterium]